MTLTYKALLAGKRVETVNPVNQYWTSLQTPGIERPARGWRAPPLIRQATVNSPIVDWLNASLQADKPLV